jgi:hypothetical protein
MNAVVNQSKGSERVDNPFATAPVVATPTGASAQAIVQREVAEVQATMMIAKRFPRDPVAAMDRILNSCTRPTLAEDATYEYARGGSKVGGASIRLAEVLAQNWGNIQCGVIELSRANGVSECMAYAIDLETLFRDEKRFQVRHWRDTKEGGYAIKEERDIYELVANMGARRKRACILAVIPGDVQETALNQCEMTLKTKVEITPEKIKAMVSSFEPFGVTPEMIEKKIQRHIDAIQPAQMVQLRRIFASLKDGMGTAADFFEVEKPQTDPSSAAEGEAQKGTAGVKQKVASKLAASNASAKSAETDLIPQFDGVSALKAIQESGSLKDLESAWLSILDDYTKRKETISNELDFAYKTQKEKLAKT